MNTFAVGPQKLVGGEISDNLKVDILLAFEGHGGMFPVCHQKRLAKNLTFASGLMVSMFQGVGNKVAIKLKQKNSPFTIGVHCMSYKSNLALQTLSKIPILRLKTCSKHYTHTLFILARDAKSLHMWPTL